MRAGSVVHAVIKGIVASFERSWSTILVVAELDLTRLTIIIAVVVIVAALSKVQLRIAGISRFRTAAVGLHGSSTGMCCCRQVNSNPVNRAVCKGETSLA